MPSPENISSTELETAIKIATLLEKQNSLEARIESEQRALREQFDSEKKSLEDRLSIAEKSVEELKNDKEKALIWGITLLGAAVMAMGAWIFRYFEKAVS